MPSLAREMEDDSELKSGVVAGGMEEEEVNATSASSSISANVFLLNVFIWAGESATKSARRLSRNICNASERFESLVWYLISAYFLLAEKYYAILFSVSSLPPAFLFLPTYAGFWTSLDLMMVVLAALLERMEIQPGPGIQTRGLQLNHHSRQFVDHCDHGQAFLADFRSLRAPLS